MPKQKIEELIPDLIRQISHGKGVSVKEVAQKYKVSADGVKKRLREVRDKFYKEHFDYDGSTRKWVVKNGHIGFLQKEILEPEEAVVLTAIYRNKSSLGKGLMPTHEKIVDSYTKRAKSYIFKQHISEEITGEMEKLFSLFKYAINEKKIVEIDFPSKDGYVTREVYPYRIVYIEYYWYLVAADPQDNKVKSFRLSLIKNPDILIDSYEYDFSNVDERLQLAMNAFVDYKAPYKYISVFVWERLVDHVDIASYFDAWKKLDETTTIGDKKFQKFEVVTTNPEFKDIIPTILKYLPNIIVDEPQEIIEKIAEIVNEYQDIYKS
ncbi:helix-turn-helix transcriptional regulator [Sulfurimonas sp.]